MENFKASYSGDLVGGPRYCWRCLKHVERMHYLPEDVICTFSETLSL